MENTNAKIFEVGKFYRFCSEPVYGGVGRRDVPHLVVRKTKKKIVFQHLYRGYDGKIKKYESSFRLSSLENGTEIAYSPEKFSMIPMMTPDNPCEKPQIWDTIQ